MEKVLIFGKGGQLGSDLAKVFKNDFETVALGHEDADITNIGQVAKIIEKEKPKFVINATAYNKVEQAESEPEKAFAVNAEGVGNLAKACKQAGTVFVHVSSDYVFDGGKDFFVETDEPDPLSVYGQSKLAGEEAVKAAISNYYLVRASSVFGAAEGKQKKNFVDTIVMKAKEGQDLRVVNDQIMSPTYSLDLARKIKELIEKPAPFGIYHITNQGSCSWYEFAEKILELAGLHAKITPITTEESGTKVNRPKKSILKNLSLEKIGLPQMPQWEDALARYLEEKYNK